MSTKMTRDIRRQIERMLAKPLERALKCYTKSYDIKVVDREEPIH